MIRTNLIGSCLSAHIRSPLYVASLNLRFEGTAQTGTL
jgi:hypothetical protein